MIEWQDKPVLVTGATGVLGYGIVTELLNRKADIVCLMRDWVPESALLQGNANHIKIVRGSITDQSLVERVLGEYRINTVFHLAAQTIVGVGNNNPVSTFDSNIRGTWTVLEACRRSPEIKNVVVASSDKVYGTAIDLPCREESPLNGIHPYDVSKVCADLLAQSYAYTYRLPVAITRCGNIYGAGDTNWDRLIPGTIRSVLRGKPPVIRSNGKTVRDYLYLDDAVEGYFKLAEHIEMYPESFRGQSFNLSPESPATTTEVVSMILGLMGDTRSPIVLGGATNEIPEQWLSSGKARCWLNWKPKVPLEEGLKKTIDWYRGYLHE